MHIHAYTCSMSAIHSEVKREIASKNLKMPGRFPTPSLKIWPQGAQNKLTIQLADSLEVLKVKLS